MKSTVDEFKARKSLPFPKLMTDGKGLIILMYKPDCGTVVGIKGHYHVIGEYLEVWDTARFHDFEGSVKLQNEH
jgi:hypothetical protein